MTPPPLSHCFGKSYFLFNFYLSQMLIPLKSGSF
jgi:hypothetical protein